MGWAGLPAEYAVYSSRAGTGKVECADITFDKPSLNYEKGGYWSITAYSGKGWLMTNNNSMNSTSAVPNKDGSYTIQFSQQGETCGGANNVIEVNDAEWKFVTRAYRPNNKAKVIEEMHNFPNVTAK